MHYSFFTEVSRPTIWLEGTPQVRLEAVSTLDHVYFSGYQF